MRSLYEAGADVFRINAAYSDDDANAALVRLVQDTIADPSDPVGTLWDLPGLKMRIGGFADGAVALEPGGTFTLDQSPEPGDEHRVYLPFPEAFAHSRVGDLLRLDDGRLTLGDRSDALPVDYGGCGRRGAEREQGDPVPQRTGADG